jgi:hypothetical protein
MFTKVWTVVLAVSKTIAHYLRKTFNSAEEQSTCALRRMEGVSDLIFPVLKHVLLGRNVRLRTMIFHDPGLEIDLIRGHGEGRTRLA